MRCSSCNAEHDRADQRYCSRCHADYQREWRKTHPNQRTLGHDEMAEKLRARGWLVMPPLPRETYSNPDGATKPRPSNPPRA